MGTLVFQQAKDTLIDHAGYYFLKTCPSIFL